MKKPSILKVRKILYVIVIVDCAVDVETLLRIMRGLETLP
jgi:hypothetical protein